MRKSLEGQVAVVTGGGRGLGRAFALHLADLGAAVVVNNRNREVDENGLGPADHVAAEIAARGGRAVANYDDASDVQIGEKLVTEALKSFGRYDILVTSAAVSLPQMLHKTTSENFTQVMDINVTGTVLTTSAALAHMRDAGHGRIILIASTAGLHGEVTVSAYAASKGAVLALARTAAVEGAGKGVFTNALLPYATTQMTEAGMDPRFLERMQSDAVSPIVGALADPTSAINGEIIVAGGASLRAADSVEWGTIHFGSKAQLAPRELEELLSQSRAGAPHTYTHAQEAFLSFAQDIVADETITETS